MCPLLDINKLLALLELGAFLLGKRIYGLSSTISKMAATDF